MAISWNELLGELPKFAQDLTEYLAELGVQDTVANLSADHVGLRIANPDDIELLKKELNTLGTCISSANVNGRQILLYQLHEPISVGNWKVSCIELPYPKKDHRYMDGWEHMELVIPSTAGTLEEMRTVLLNTFPMLDLDRFEAAGQYEESLPYSEEDQLPNPSLIFEKYRGLGVKFHPRPIQEVVGYTK